jgi:hypothetical protein
LPDIDPKDDENSGYSAAFQLEEDNTTTNYGTFTVTITDASITSGEVTVTWNNVSKIFKFKIINGTEDYNLIVSPQVVNVDALPSSGTS